MVVKFATIYLFILSAIDDEQKLKGFIWIYTLVVCFIFCEAFSNGIRGINIRYNSGAMRLFGPPGYFGHPNGLGGLTAASLPFLYYLIAYYKPLKIRICLIGLMLIALRVIMYTNSRTAFVGTVTFFMLIRIYSKK